MPGAITSPGYFLMADTFLGYALGIFMLAAAAALGALAYFVIRSSHKE